LARASRMSHGGGGSFYPDDGCCDGRRGLGRSCRFVTCCGGRACDDYGDDDDRRLQRFLLLKFN
jgi:hypothetical protein